MSNFLLLIFEFFKTGLFAIGGGLATIPFLQDMAVKYHWFSTEMLTTMIAISESTPGPMGINMATYVGYHMFGLPGAIATSLAIVTPSIIVICIIANMLKKFKENQTVQDIFYGLRPAVVALIAVACIDIFLITLFNVDFTSIGQLFNWKSWILLLVLVVVNHFKKLNPILIILFCATIGAVFAF